MGEYGYEDGHHSVLLGVAEWGAAARVYTLPRYPSRGSNIAVFIFVGSRGPFVPLKI
jgi:hypothetical protein